MHSQAIARGHRLSAQEKYSPPGLETYLYKNFPLPMLKARNLLLNNKGVLKIADFGLARFHYDYFGELSQNIATFWYKAPEIFYGNYKYSDKVDIWAIG
jgi:cell division cycle 2-like protein